MMNSKSTPYTIPEHNATIRNFRNRASTSDSVLKSWFEARTITIADIRFKSIDSVMHSGSYQLNMSDKVAYDLRKQGKATVMISYQITKYGNYAYARLVDQEKMIAMNQKQPSNKYEGRGRS